MRGLAATLVRCFVMVALAALLSISLGISDREAHATDRSQRLVASGPKTKDGIEIPALRTRNSRTYQSSTGSFVAVVSAGAVNYRDVFGEWQPIDNTLGPARTAGYAFENRANSYRLSLPSELSAAPVRVQQGQDWMTFSLDGAHGNGKISGATQTFTNALPETSVSYTAGGDVVKEALALASASAPSSFTFSLSGRPGLTPELNDRGGVDFRRGGHVRFSFTAPVMTDAAGVSSRALSFSLAQGQGGYSLTLNVNQAWLQRPERRFPVVVDPTVTFAGALYDCYLVSGSPDTNYCGVGTNLDVGTSGSSTSRALLKWDLSGLPASAIVLDANMSLYLQSAANSTPVVVGAHHVTSAWGQTATWNKRDSVNNWTVPGGDFVANTAGGNTPTTIGAAGNWYHWRFTQLAQGWLNGSIENDGILLKSEDDSVQNVLHFSSSADYSFLPELRFTYEYGIGLRDHYSYDQQQLNDRMGLGVNVANGNLVLSASDLHIAGTGLDLDVARYYNSLSSGFDTNGGCELGCLWQLGTGIDVYFKFFDDGSAAYYGPSGYAVPFVRTPSGDYLSPTALDVTLKKNGDGTYTLSSHFGGDKQNFDATGKLTSLVDENNNTISFAYTASSHSQNGYLLSSITDTQARITSFTYDTNGHLTKITDPSGRLYKYAYDAAYHLITYTDPAGKLTKYAYAAGVLTQITDPRNNLIKFTYDTENRVSTIVRVTGGGTGPTTRFTYNASNSVVTDPNGHTTTYTYDADRRVTQVVDALGHTVTAGYNDDGKVTTVTDADNNIWQSGYDPNNEILRWTQAPQQTATNRPTLDYTDTLHPYYLTKHANVDGGVWNYGYDTNGNLSQKDEGSGQNPVKFTYNTNGTVATATDGRNIGNAACTPTTVTYCFGYDAKGNLTSITNPAPLGIETFTYDTLSRVKTATDGKGQTTTYTYDNLDRVTNVAFQGGSSVTFVYDTNGNVTNRTGATGSTTYIYDALNRQTKETRPSTGSTTYVYDNADNLSSLTDPGGSVGYHYDAADRLDALTEPGGAQTIFHYNNRNERTETAYPNGISLYITYDNSARLKTVTAKVRASGAVLKDYLYSYDNAGNDSELRRSVTFTDSNGSVCTTAYGYDTLTRLKTASGCGHSYSYDYDADGNMYTKTVDGTTSTYGFNDANEINNAGYNFDAAGNQTAGGGLSFTYNTANQTTAIGSTAMTYADVGQAERITVGGITYTNDELGVAREGTTEYIREPGGTLIDQRTPSGNYYYLFDGLGSVIGLTNSSGGLVASYSYEPYGKLVSSTGTITNPWRFAGGYYDSSTGLYHFGQRYYDPTTGRWTQGDPIDNPLASHGWNRYIYAGDNPVNFTDPTGLICGPGGGIGDALIPDYIFTSACGFHDKCYGTPHRLKSTCDNGFYSLMRSACNSKYSFFSPKRYGCHALAAAYFAAVRSAVGQGVFFASQYGLCRRQGRSRTRCAAVAAYLTAR
jgi:RHS repeat-associated protein